MQEVTRQQEYQTKIKEYEAHVEQAKVEQKRIDHEERRKTLVVRKNCKIKAVQCQFYFQYFV